jgi:SAM-dependent methyltransferase
MPYRREDLIADHGLRIAVLEGLTVPPPPWEPGEARFWNDPHISVQMLAAHLDPSMGAASAPPAAIDATVDWICERLTLGRGHALVDLGCGPGLYTRRFAARGLDVTGIDLSATSIEHARLHDVLGAYRLQDYLDLSDRSAFDVATLIYGDYCTLDDTQRPQLLGNVHRALRPGGWFVLDVSTEARHLRHNCGDGWSAHPGGGFWKPGAYLALMRHHRYPDLDLALDQYAIVEANGTLSVYRNWFRYFTRETITAELEAGGFTVRGLYGDLAGAPYDPGGEWIGVVAQQSPS